MGFDYGRHFSEIKLAHDLTTTRDERTWRLEPTSGQAEHHDVILYLGCNVLRTPHMIRTILAIFDRLGLDYVTVGGAAYCCGIVHHNHGDTAAAGGMSDHTISVLRRFTPEYAGPVPAKIHATVTLCPKGGLPFRIHPLS